MTPAHFDDNGARHNDDLPWEAGRISDADAAVYARKARVALFCGLTASVVVVGALVWTAAR